MKLFKYKSLSPFEYVSDILFNSRFYAAKFFELNDPMEGRFDHDPETKREFLLQVIAGKKRLNICSFSKDMGNLLLWAHYADSFRGICIEIEAEDTPDSKVVQVNYSPFSVYVSNESASDLDGIPEIILRNKNEAWEYEEEVRILSKNQSIEEGVKINAIYLGLRTSPVMKDTIVQLVSDRIPVFETQINESTNTIERGLRYKRQKRMTKAEIRKALSRE